MMMLVVAGIIGGLGLACMTSRRSVLGFMIGVQLLILGSTMVFVLAGMSAGKAQGQVFGLFIALGGIAQLVIGYALSVRLFYLKKQVSMDELRTLKQ
jgi:NADH:ubiquinone oxidoreductase subunit K